MSPRAGEPARRAARGVRVILAALAAVALSGPGFATTPAAPCAGCGDSLARATGFFGVEGRLLPSSTAGAPRGHSAFRLETNCGMLAVFVRDSAAAESGLPRALANGLGRGVWARLACADAAHPVLAGGHALGDSVLDLFVESLCPFARSLELRMAVRIAAAGPGRIVAPVRVHYLLFPPDSASGGRISSMHGEREVAEDAVQIVLREHYPAHFWAYLALRGTNAEDWRTLAARAGLSWREVAAIGHRVERDGDALLRAELAHVSGDYPPIDGSPTPFWRGREVRNLAEVPGFQKIGTGAGQCPH